MKKITTISLLAASLLSACATAPQMSDSEKDQIKKGQLVEFTSYYNKTSDAIKRAGKVYVCVVSTYKPTSSSTCYPKLSEYFNKAFAAAGIDIASSKADANEVVYATFNYFYVGSELTSSKEGYIAMVDQTIESSLSKSDKPILSETEMEKIFNGNKELRKSVVHQSELATAGNIAVGIAGVMLGGVNGGLATSQALTGLANPASIVAPYGTTGNKNMGIQFTVHGNIMSFVGYYDGPKDLFQSFAPLFPSAVSQSATFFAKNTATVSASQ